MQFNGTLSLKSDLNCTLEVWFAKTLYVPPSHEETMLLGIAILICDYDSHIGIISFRSAIPRNGFARYKSRVVLFHFTSIPFNGLSYVFLLQSS